MDEPFGALDPIAPARLQDEFRQTLSRVRKAVVMVTHDLDEAIKIGDRIAIMEEGKIVQFDTPNQILSHPLDDFVESFVGIDRAIKRLSLFADAMVAEPVNGRLAGPALASVAGETSPRDAPALMVAANSEALCVVDAYGQAVGTLTHAVVFAA